MNSYISVVIPVYCAEKILIKLHKELVKELSKITKNFQIIFVNDGSKDSSWDCIKKIVLKDSCVKGLNLSKNYGQHVAISAGIHHSNSDWVVVMDCDFQDPPSEIIKLYSKAKSGYDVVFGKRVVRQDSWFKKTTSRIFFFVLSLLSEHNIDYTTNTFTIVNKKVIDSYKKINDFTRSYPFEIRSLGYNQTSIEIKHSERLHGKSTYSISSLINLSFNYIILYSVKPLRISITIGFIISIFAFLLGILIILRYYFLKISIIGWTSLIISIFFVFGVLLINLGIIGLYIGAIYNEVKKKPLYFISEEC